MELNNYLQIYNYPFFSNTNVKDFVSSVEYKPREMIVTRPINDTFTYVDLYNSIHNRVPIYYGCPCEKWYNYPTVNYEQPYGIRYAICGIAYVLDNKPFVAIHTWGINLEMPTTTDYKNIVHDNKIDQNKYRVETVKIIECIEKARIYYNLSKVYMPLLGQGQYLSYIPKSERIKATTIFFEEVCKTNTVVVIPSKHSITKNLYHQYKDNIENGNIFTPREGKYGIVNAWDSNSFIGNGGSRDPTIDGWFVAGYGPNKDLINSSILHNPLFNPKLLSNII